jgi:ribosomal protein L3 glutamine methyltransferase
MNEDQSPVFTTAIEALEWCAAAFETSDLYYGHGTENADDEAFYLMMHTMPRAFKNGQFLEDLALNPEEKNLVITRAQERITTRKPMAYIVGEAWFGGLQFCVSRDVLIPRSPIAELILKGYQPWVDLNRLTKVLDLCTGSGCIAILTAAVFPSVLVDASDISRAALKIAQENVKRHELTDRVRIIQSDLFQTLKGEQYDLIVSNPPYVDQNDFETMPQEYQHEPALALTSGQDGLELTRRILREAPQHLAKGGVLIVEVGNSQYALSALYPQVDFTWLCFENGGDGVFMLTREQLVEYQSVFAAS